MENDHAIYSPSRLKRIITCPGSTNLIDILLSERKIKPQKQSSYAAEGTKLHEITEYYYHNGPNGRRGKALDMIDKEQALLVRDCADYADTIFAGIGHKSFAFSSEQKVSLISWGIPNVWGTCDYQIYDIISQHMHIIDWKFGKGVPVYAYKNPQLLAYAAGAIEWPTQVKKITLHVVQPPIDNYDTYSLTIDELYEWVHGTLAIAINKCSTDTDNFVPTKEGCRWCEAKNHCAARLAAANEIAAKLFEAYKQLANVPSIDDLVKLLDQAPLVEDVIKGISVYIMNELQHGRDIKGFKLVEGRSNRKWKDEKEAVKWLSENTEIEELFESKLRSPSQLEKEAKILKTDKDFQGLFHNPPGKTTIARDYDKRPALKPEAKATNVFSDYSDLD